MNATSPARPDTTEYAPYYGKYISLVPEWNTCRIELRGTRLKATLNGEMIQNVDLSKFDQPVKRHDGSLAPPIKDRPGKGHIGFQHLSRQNEPIAIRGVRIKELK